MSDKDPISDLDCLETALFLNVPESDDVENEGQEGAEEENGKGGKKESVDYGGYISFVEKNEKEEVRTSNWNS